MTRPLFLHVGASKTGTSSLQGGVSGSLEALSAAGVGVPLHRRRGKSLQLLQPLGWSGVDGYTNPMDLEALDGGVRRIAKVRGDRLLLSAEDLADAGEEQVHALVDRLESRHDLECHVLITARPWTRQLPSDYQQKLKQRLTVDFETFLCQVRDGEGELADGFRVRQDFADIAARWSTSVPAERITVVPVDSRDPGGLFTTFAALVGYPDGTVTPPRKSVNQSFGLVEAEVLRRFNLSLGDRLSNVREEYNPGVRRILTRGGTLARNGQVRITLPPEHLEWVQAAGRAQLDRLAALGVRVHGDAELLVADAADAKAHPEITEEMIAAAALDTFANFAVESFKDYRAAREAAAGGGGQVEDEEPGSE